MTFLPTRSRSHVPPVRDDESETQRKAHAKLVRQTRRSTQGVTLEDLKSAEKLKSRNHVQQLQVRCGKESAILESNSQFLQMNVAF